MPFTKQRNQRSSQWNRPCVLARGTNLVWQASFNREREDLAATGVVLDQDRLACPRFCNPVCGVCYPTSRDGLG